MSLCVSTGWCAHHEGHNNKSRSVLQNSPEWLEDYWRPHIEAQIKPDAWLIYHSRCDIPAELPLYGGKMGEELVFASVPARELPYRHDWVASMLCGAVYAYCNNMDYLYIEQDCLVHNIPAVLEFAQDKPMCYGFGRYSFYAEWSENSLTWVRNDTLGLFISRLATSGIKDLDDIGVKPEVVWHRKYNDIMTPWPFGYGRVRPIDFTQPVFYAQQLTDAEIRGFQDALHRLR